jgi:SAM-dependent methyltransferase
VLFLEVVLIRWVSTEIRVFAYIKNLPLLASFLGIGLGSLLATRQSVFKWGAVSLAILVALVALSGPLQLTNLIFPGNNYAVWGARAIVDSVYYAELAKFTFTIVGVTALIVLTFVALGQEMGRLMNLLPALSGYQSNILGSLSGVVAFGLVSWSGAGPFWWMLLVAAAWLASYHWSCRRSVIPAICCTAIIGSALVCGRAAIWTPYYRVDVRQIPPEHSDVPLPETAGYYVDVNHDYHQKILNLSEDFKNRYASRFLESQRLVYDLPYQFGRAGDVLVVGAGTGNDVAAALRAGARSVTAVEIDPAILALGRRTHPEKPYASDRVRVVNDDARHFFHTTTDRFDQVVFGHLDSHTMLSSMSSVRLDNFVYTQESLNEASGLLRDDGWMVLSFAGGRSFPTERIVRMLDAVSGREPKIYQTDYDSAGMSLVSVRGTRTMVAPPQLARLETHLNETVKESATDDWPYLYLRSPSVPFAYFWTFGALFLAGAASLVGSRGMTGPATGSWRADWPMLLLGAGFMLLETKSITSLALFYGSTWIVNSVVIAVILIAIFFSNLLVIKVPGIRAWWAVVLIVVALVANYYLRLERFVGLGWWTRTMVAAALLGIPVFCAGIIFSSLFARRVRRSQALGWNLVGAMLGGLVENVSMIWGLNILNLAAAACYLGVAFFVGRKAE